MYNSQPYGNSTKKDKDCIYVHRREVILLRKRDTHYAPQLVGWCHKAQSEGWGHGAAHHGTPAEHWNPGRMVAFSTPLKGWAPHLRTGGHHR